MDIEIWLDFQEALVIVAGVPLAVMASFFLAGAVLLAVWDAATALFRRYAP